MVICVLFHLTILYKTSYKRFTVRGTIRAEPEHLGLEGGGTSGFGRNHPRIYGKSCFPVNGVLETDTASRMARSGNGALSYSVRSVVSPTSKESLYETVVLFAYGVVSAGVAGYARSGGYPEKPINMIIAFTAGGSSDVQARIMQKYWNKYAPQPWVFVYKPGAGGIIGFTEIAKARPDGYTIGGLNVPHIILQPLAQNAQFAPDSFKYICQVVNDPQCIAVRKDSPYQSTSEIIAAARKNPGKIRVGLVGPLSGHHLMFLDYGKKYPDAKLTSVFYKGAADQNAALLGGEIDMIFGNINDVMRSIDEFRVLNVAAEKRNGFLPDVPTLREAGIDMVSDIRRCFAAPKGIKPAELDALRVLFKKICEDPEYLADMKKAGQPAEYMDGEAFAAYIAGQQAHAQEALSAAGLLKK